MHLMASFSVDHNSAKQRLGLRELIVTEKWFQLADLTRDHMNLKELQIAEIYSTSVICLPHHFLVQPDSTLSWSI